MRTALDAQISDSRVAGAAVSVGAYDEDGRCQRAAEALRWLTETLGWYAPDRGPFAHVIPPGAKVVIKPNLVLHENQGAWGIEPLVTHPSIIMAATQAALLAGASEVVVGDAPVQGCDLAYLMQRTGLDAWAEALRRDEPRFKGIRDFRRTTCVYVDGVRRPTEGRLPEDHFVLFDLGSDSLLEPVTDERSGFRVTCYDPRLLANTHAKGRHMYLIAREIMEADVVINLPKLKTHKKAGITCALKNLVGINGNKEYLPHHRLGGSSAGGDCYPGASLVKSALEHAADRQNMATSVLAARVWHRLVRNLDQVARLQGDQVGVEGSWWGNDTVWRTCLDLNRILLYGQTDASMKANVQRTVVHVVDAVMAGQGDGPLAPRPLPLGLVFAGQNAVAVDWVGARLLGFDPQRVSLTRQAFGPFPWPLASFGVTSMVLLGDWGAGVADRVIEGHPAPVLPVIHPCGWVDAAPRQAQPCQLPSL